MAPEAAAGSTGKTCEPDPSLAAWLAAQGFPPPLIQACRLGDRPIVDAPLEAGAHLDALNGDGNNALWLACFNENLDIIDRLASSGIAIDHQNDAGATCLMYAASSGKTAVVARLLQSGADITLRNQDDFTALDMAANLECLKLLRSATVAIST
jgi:ankyrin repeat protein